MGVHRDMLLFLRAKAKCNLHLWWENTCWATWWPCVYIAALWLEVFHVQYVKLMLFMYRLFQFDPAPGDFAKDVEWSSDNKRDLWFPSLRLWYPCLFVWAAVFFLILGIIFGFDFGPNFGYHFCPYFWGVLQKKWIDGLWEREQKLYPKLGPKFNVKKWIQKRKKGWLKQTSADIKDAEIDLACCRLTMASLWRSRRALDQVSKAIDWKKNQWNILHMKEFSQAKKVYFNTWPQCCSTRAFSRKV